jgi:hypothetical protein
MHQDKDVNFSLIELSAQSIAAATMGLALKLIVEKDLDEMQRETIITYFSEVVVVRMAGMED